jgi:hypothetical protein
MNNKIVVPEGMLKEARHAFFDPSKALREASDTECLFSAIEAALRWWLENPMCPTHVEVESILSMVQFQGLRGTNLDRLQDFAVMWQRRMFIESEPESDPKLFDTAFGRIEIDDRIPPGEVWLRNWNGTMRFRNIGRADPEAVRSFIKNEVEIGWRDGLVTAGPFIRQNACWTPDQAEKFAEHLKSSAQKAREQKLEEPEVPKDEVKDLMWPNARSAGDHDRSVIEAYRRGRKSK